MTQIPDVFASKVVDVPLSAVEAFALFTRDIALWWPKGGPQLRFAPRKGGDITEIGPDGTAVTRGTVLAFDPAGFLAFSWHPAAFPDAATIVTVVFEQTVDGCRVTLTQGTESVLGPLADAVSTSFLRNGSLVLGAFHAQATCVTIAA